MWLLESEQCSSLMHVAFHAQSNSFRTRARTYAHTFVCKYLVPGPFQNRNTKNPGPSNCPYSSSSFERQRIFVHVSLCLSLSMSVSSSHIVIIIPVPGVGYVSCLEGHAFRHCPWCGSYGTRHTPSAGLRSVQALHHSEMDVRAHHSEVDVRTLH